MLKYKMTYLSMIIWLHFYIYLKSYFYDNIVKKSVEEISNEMWQSVSNQERQTNTL